MTTTTTPADPTWRAMPRIGKRPKVGDKVDLKFGLSIVQAVRKDGQRLIVMTMRHGQEHVERHRNGNWTIYERIR